MQYQQSKQKDSLIPEDNQAIQTVKERDLRVQQLLRGLPFFVGWMQMSADQKQGAQLLFHEAFRQTSQIRCSTSISLLVHVFAQGEATEVQ